MTSNDNMSPFGADLFALGASFTRCRDLDRAIREHVRQREEEPDWSVVIPAAESFEKEDFDADR